MSARFISGLSALVGLVSKRMQLQAAVARQATQGGGWALLDDAGHKSEGIASAAASGGNLVLTFDKTTPKVGALLTANDETFAGLGLAHGSSVAGSSATVSFFKTLDCTLNMGTRALVPSTYFAGRCSAVLNGDGSVTVTHPSCGSATVIPVCQELDAFENRPVSYTATTVTFATFTLFAGYIEWTGSAWAVTTAAKEKPTVAFASGVLTVTHEALPVDEAAVKVDGRDVGGGTNLVHVRPGTSTATTFEAVFRDNAGAMVTAPNTSMRLYYQGTHKVRREVPAGVLAFSRDNTKLDVADVYSGSGNLWAIGLQGA